MIVIRSGCQERIREWETEIKQLRFLLKDYNSCAFIVSVSTIKFHQVFQYSIIINCSKFHESGFHHVSHEPNNLVSWKNKHHWL